jgi:hypothetical protein
MEDMPCATLSSNVPLRHSFIQRNHVLQCSTWTTETALTLHVCWRDHVFLVHAKSPTGHVSPEEEQCRCPPPPRCHRLHHPNGNHVTAATDRSSGASAPKTQTAMSATAVCPNPPSASTAPACPKAVRVCVASQPMRQTIPRPTTRPARATPWCLSRLVSNPRGYLGVRLAR